MHIRNNLGSSKRFPERRNIGCIATGMDKVTLGKLLSSGSKIEWLQQNWVTNSSVAEAEVPGSRVNLPETGSAWAGILVSVWK